jgi:hypothetical protein
VGGCSIRGGGSVGENKLAQPNASGSDGQFMRSCSRDNSSSVVNLEESYMEGEAIAIDSLTL